jgi:hypothetical protein
MFLCYVFIGKLPSYIIETIHQARLYFNGDIYLIIDDLNSPFKSHLEKYSIILCDYNEFICQRFIDTVNTNINKFCIVNGLTGREKLFIYSFERFFILKNLMRKYNLVDCLFLELDNMIYDDPLKWIENFSQNQLCYMYDNIDRCSSGIMYVKNNESLTGLLEYALNYISTSNEFLNEMTVLSRYFEINKKEVQLLPTFWKDNTLPTELHQHYNMYNNTIFDAAAIGIYLLGKDPFHTNGIIVKYLKNELSILECRNYTFEWKKDEKGRNKPYIWDGEKWLLINNLHVHSKDLRSGLSLPIE